VAAQPDGKAAPEPPRYLRTTQVADILQVSPKTASRWAKDGKLPFLRTLGVTGAIRHRGEICQLAEGSGCSREPSAERCWNRRGREVG
jgi:excisionase family DNA binding protein